MRLKVKSLFVQYAACFPMFRFIHKIQFAVSIDRALPCSVNDRSGCSALRLFRDLYLIIVMASWSVV